MIIGKLIKPCRICLYESDDGGEKESFTLLKLSFKEALGLYNDALCNGNKIEYPLDESVVIQYSGNDNVHTEWKAIAVEHEKNSPMDFIDLSSEFKTSISGTSCLIRDPKNHIIKIALRKGNDKIVINRVCIDNAIRERFFSDVKATKRYKESGHFAMDTRDLDIYKYWSNYMNVSFISQYKDYKKLQTIIV